VIWTHSAYPSAPSGVAGASGCCLAGVSTHPCEASEQCNIARRRPFPVSLTVSPVRASEAAVSRRQNKVTSEQVSAADSSCRCGAIFDILTTFTVEFFNWDTKKACSAVLTGDGDLFTDSLLEPHVYCSAVAYQFKQMLYHSGILAESGSDSSDLEPEESDWNSRSEFRGCRSCL